MASDSRKDTPSPARPGGEPRRVVRMGKYEVVQHIATGGMGAVYRARDTETGRDVALKVLLPDLAARDKVLERFKREARSARKLSHENVVALHEFGEIQGTHYLALEYIEGVDLHNYMKRNGPFDPEEARQIVLQGARALRAAHEQHVVHRDVKPSNFLLTRKDNRAHVKLTDFGLARELNADELRVTRAGTTVGTVDYMSPEQARDSWAADIRSDLYSLGATWYHLLVGHPPFPEGNLSERLVKIIQHPPPDIRDIDPLISSETWEILSRLLAKDPNERYQTPDELIEDLEVLEGRTVAGDPRKGPRALGRKKPRREAAPDRPATNEQRGRLLWYAMAGLAALALVGGIAVIASMPRKPPLTPDEEGVVAPTPVIPATPKVPDDMGRKPVLPPVVPPEVGGPPEKLGPPTPAVEPLPYLARASQEVNVEALRREVEGPWADVPAVPPDAQVVQVRRGAPVSATTFRSLAAACRSAPAGKALVVEIHDNGPLFELPCDAVEGRDLVVRAGKGYRPLVIWDVQGAAALKTARKPDEPLVFLPVRKGRLFLEGLELAWRWPEPLSRPGVLLDAEDADLFLTDCTVSAAGKPPSGVTLARLRSAKESRCRLSHCHARGAGLTALDLEAPRALVLLDGCLIVGGQQSLLRVISGDRKGPKLRAVRSTLVGGSALLELRPGPGLRGPGLSWLAWDSLLGRANLGEGGDLLALRDGALADNVEWRGVNCLYAGWKHLLAGPRVIAGDDLRAWQRHWSRREGEGASREPWPEQAFSEPASQPASAYQPAGAVRFAATVNPEQPLGCDLAALPPCRDGWVVLALEPTFSVPEAPSDGSAPEIPNPGDGKFHGARVDVKEKDLGTYLARVQATEKLGPRVVLHLTGKGDQPTSPLRLKGASLVLYFEQPAESNAPRLSLTLSRPTRLAPMVEVEGGSLEVINGGLRVSEATTTRVSHLVRVTGGDLRLYRCKLQGPQQKTPEGWVAAVGLQGSGELAADRAHLCAVNQSVIVSGTVGVELSGVGSRLALRHSLVVAGTDALHLAPGPGAKGRAGMQCSLANVTFAAGRAVAWVGDVPADGPVIEPVLVQARDCAYLNPFTAGGPGKAGLLVHDGALARGAILWQGQREAFDSRLHFAAASLRDGVPEAKEGYAAWKALWGSSGCREPRELRVSAAVFPPGRWVLERLKLRAEAGANLDRLWLKPIGR